MSSIADVFPSPKGETVSVNGKDVQVYALGARFIGELLNQYPELRKYFSGVELDTGSLFRDAFHAVPAIIAAGLGKPGDAEAERQADLIGLDAQMDLIGGVMKATMPRGLGPFVQKLEGLGLVVRGDSQPSTT